MKMMISITLLDVLVEAVVLGEALDVGEAAAVDVAEEQLVGRNVARHEHVLRIQRGVVLRVDAAFGVSVGPSADTVELRRRQRDEAGKGQEERFHSHFQRIMSQD